MVGTLYTTSVYILVYYILKNDEEKLNKLALITNTINLSRTNLENYEICIPSEEFQQKIIDTVSIYDKICEMLRLFPLNI